MHSHAGVARGRATAGISHKHSIAEAIVESENAVVQAASEGHAKSPRKFVDANGLSRNFTQMELLRESGRR
jgi:hypothetical protein